MQDCPVAGPSQMSMVSWLFTVRECFPGAQEQPAVAGSSRFVGKCIPEMSVMPPSGRHFSRE
jgi:hypothetical protein